MNDSEIKIKNALTKKAVGYSAKEVVEEYQDDGEGGMKLTKRRVTKKHVPPDTIAAKMVLESFALDNALVNFTDEQLESEKLRLLNLLKENEDADRKTDA